MATTLRADAKIYDPRTRIEYTERIAQNIAVFNEGTGGAIRLISAEKGGDFDYKSLWSQPAVNPISRRDLTSMAALTGQKLTQAEKIGVKINRTFGPLEMTMDTLRKIGESLSGDEDPMDLVLTKLGENAANYTTQDKVNVSISALSAAIRQNAGAVSDLSAGATAVSADALNTAFFKRGDRFSEIKTVVMHSVKAAQLYGGQITANTTGVASIIMSGGDAFTLGRKLVITDSPSLVIAGAPNKYVTLGLVEDAMVVEDSEGEIFFTDYVTGQAQLYYRAQGEYAYNEAAVNASATSPSPSSNSRFPRRDWQ